MAVMLLLLSCEDRAPSRGVAEGVADEVQVDVVEGGVGCRDLPEADARGIQCGDDRADRGGGVVGAGGEDAADAGCLDDDVAQARDPGDRGAHRGRVGLDERARARSRRAARPSAARACPARPRGRG